MHFMFSSSSLVGPDWQTEPHCSLLMAWWDARCEKTVSYVLDTMLPEDDHRRDPWCGFAYDGENGWWWSSDGPHGGGQTYYRANEKLYKSSKSKSKVWSFIVCLRSKSKVWSFIVYKICSTWSFLPICLFWFMKHVRNDRLVRAWAPQTEVVFGIGGDAWWFLTTGMALRSIMMWAPAHWRSGMNGRYGEGCL